MLYNQIIRPLEGALRAKISPLQFYALMALKQEGLYDHVRPFGQCGVSKQQSTRLINSLAEPAWGTPALQADRRLIFICLSPYGKNFLERLRLTACRAIEERLGVLNSSEQESMLLSLETIGSSWTNCKEGNPT